MKPSESEIREFWEWCGFCYFDGWFYEEGGKRVARWGGIPNLNNLFKYAVPKLFEQGYFVSLVSDKRFNRASILSGLLDRHETAEFIGEHKDLALALFWAIWKVIK